jgi:hypothetical protein
MKVNMLIVAATALLPLIIGFIWYNPKVMGTIWMKETGITPDPENPPKMGPILIANLVAGFFLAMGLMFIVIHQQAIYSILTDEPVIISARSNMVLFMVLRRLLLWFYPLFRYPLFGSKEVGNTSGLLSVIGPLL